MGKQGNSQIAAGVMYGVINAILCIPVSVSFCSIIFRNDAFALYLPKLVKLVLFSSAVHQVGFSLFSSLPFAIGQVQDAGLIFLGAIATNIVQSVTNESFIVPTTLFVLPICTLVLGLLLLVVSKLKLAQFIQYLPMTVIGGYLAYIGYFCGSAGLAMMSGLTGIITFEDYLDTKVIILLSPGLITGISMYILLRNVHSPFILPVCMVSILVVFFGILWLSGASLQDARDYGWVAPLTTEEPFYESWNLYDINNVDWFQLPRQISPLIAMFLVVAFSSSLDVAAIEMELGMPLDYNRELFTVGMSNVMSGISGGYTGSYIFSQTIFNMRRGIQTKATGIVVALCEFLVVMMPFSITSFLPKCFFGAMLILIAVDLMFEWLVASRDKMMFFEYIVCLLTFVSILFTGIEVGMSIGVMLATISFVISYARLQTVSVTALMNSTVIRTFEDRNLLMSNRGKIVTVSLKGYVFFGSAVKLLEELKSHIMVRLPDGQSMSNEDLFANYAKLKEQQGQVQQQKDNNNGSNNSSNNVNGAIHFAQGDVSHMHDTANNQQQQTQHQSSYQNDPAIIYNNNNNNDDSNVPKLGFYMMTPSLMNTKHNRRLSGMIPYNSLTQNSSSNNINQESPTKKQPDITEPYAFPDLWGEAQKTFSTVFKQKNSSQNNLNDGVNGLEMYTPPGGNGSSGNNINNSNSGNSKNNNGSNNFDAMIRASFSDDANDNARVGRLSKDNSRGSNSGGNNNSSSFKNIHEISSDDKVKFIDAWGKQLLKQRSGSFLEPSDSVNKRKARGNSTDWGLSRSSFDKQDIEEGRLKQQSIIRDNNSNSNSNNDNNNGNKSKFDQLRGFWNNGANKSSNITNEESQSLLAAAASRSNSDRTNILTYSDSNSVNNNNHNSNNGNNIINGYQALDSNFNTTPNTNITSGRPSLLNQEYFADPNDDDEDSDDEMRTEYLILDFTAVLGVDTTAARSCFLMLVQLMRTAQVSVVFANMSPSIEYMLRAHHVINDVDDMVIPNLDDALEWCEDQILHREYTESKHHFAPLKKNPSYYQKAWGNRQDQISLTSDTADKRDDNDKDSITPKSQSVKPLRRILNDYLDLDIINSTAIDMNEILASSVLNQYFIRTVYHSREIVFDIDQPANKVYFIENGVVEIVTISPLILEKYQSVSKKLELEEINMKYQEEMNKPLVVVTKKRSGNHDHNKYSNNNSTMSSPVPSSSHHNNNNNSDNGIYSPVPSEHGSNISNKLSFDPTWSDSISNTDAHVKRVNKVSKGGVFGESDFILGKKHSVRAYTITDAVVWTLDKQQFNRMKNEQPNLCLLIQHTLLKSLAITSNCAMYSLHPDTAYAEV